jgi:hypothetical protein
MAEELNAILRRMDAMERNQSDQARIITGIIEEAGQIDARVKVLEGIQQDRRVVDVERNAREQSMQKDIESIRADLTSIKTGINRVLWAVASAVIVVFVGFVLRGGLHG